MKAAILSVGTELLFGQITNTNTVYLSQQLNMLGHDVMAHYTVGDNPDRLEEMIGQIYKDCDLIITTGGLGPTQDDLTKEIACKALNDKMICHEESLEWLEGYFKKLGRTMTENNKKQANMPSRATVFDNDSGTAPGFALEDDGKTIICLPGPPREMERMFERKAKPYLAERSDSAIFYRLVRFIGIGESALETELVNLIDNQTDPTLATYAKEGECSLRIASKRKTKEEAKAAVDEMLEKVKSIVGEYIYSSEDENLVDIIGEKLIKNKITISCAESCTGGMFAETITNVPGISAVFDRGLVTYSNNAKMEELDVKKETLDTYGAVSSETALEMVRGLQKVTGSDLCISVTGIAGPDGATEDKPVGLVYISAVYKGQETTKKVQMRNVNRKWNRTYSVTNMLHLIYDLIQQER